MAENWQKCENSDHNVDPSFSWVDFPEHNPQILNPRFRNAVFKECSSSSILGVNPRVKSLYKTLEVSSIGAPSPPQGEKQMLKTGLANQTSGRKKAAMPTWFQGWIGFT
jgi:hypothetical protein